MTRLAAAVLALAFLIAGCAAPEPQKKTVIAVSMIGETHDWPVGVAYYAEREVKAAAEENGWDYRYEIASDANEQSNQVIGLVNDGVDCIIMLPMDGASLKTAAMTVQAAHIPLVIFDREIPDFAPTATVKGDNTGIGTKTADLFNGYFPDGTTVLEIMGDTSTVPQQRTDGFDEVLHSNFNKIQLGFTGWQRAESRELFESWAKSEPQEHIDRVGAIFTHDDEIALGVLDALDAFKETPGSKTFDKLRVIAGSAGSQEMYRRIRDEKKYTLFSLTYSPDMINRAIRTGESIIKGEAYEEMTIIPTREVNRGNVSEYIDDSLPY